MIKKRSGQAMLISVMIIFTCAITLAIAASAISLSELNGLQNQKNADQAYNLAASGIENEILRMERGDFSAPAQFNSADGSCIISISGGNGSYTVLAVAQSSGPLSIKKATKKIQATINVNQGLVDVSQIRETQ